MPCLEQLLKAETWARQLGVGCEIQWVPAFPPEFLGTDDSF